jgi:hypothetical protein
MLQLGVTIVRIIDSINCAHFRYCDNTTNCFSFYILEKIYGNFLGNIIYERLAWRISRAAKWLKVLFTVRMLQLRIQAPGPTNPDDGLSSLDGNHCLRKSAAPPTPRGEDICIGIWTSLYNFKF